MTPAKLFLSALAAGAAALVLQAATAYQDPPEKAESGEAKEQSDAPDKGTHEAEEAAQNAAADMGDVDVPAEVIDVGVSKPDPDDPAPKPPKPKRKPN